MAIVAQAHTYLPLSRRRRASAHPRAVRIVLLCVAVALAAACSKREETLPTDATARSIWMQSPAAAKLSEADQKLMRRFIARLDEQNSAGSGASSAVAVSIPHALEVQTAYERNVAQAQTRLQEQFDRLKGEVTLQVIDSKVVKAESPPAPSGKALSFVVRVNNRGKRTVDRVVMRIEIRESTGKYQAAIPSLDLTGPLQPGDVGRSTQTLALDPSLHRYILDGKPLQIDAYPLEIAFADGTKLAPGDDLKALETLHHAKVE